MENADLAEHGNVSTSDVVSLQLVRERISNLKPFLLPNDVIHLQYLKQIVESVGLELVSFINKSLQTGSVPDKNGHCYTCAEKNFTLCNRPSKFPPNIHLTFSKVLKR